MNVSFLLSDFKFPPTPDCGILHKLTIDNETAKFISLENISFMATQYIFSKI